MGYCCVYMCNTGTKTQRTARSSLHAFPKDPRLRAVWTSRVGRVNWQPSASSKICGLHFTRECFVIDPVVRRSLGAACPSAVHLKPGSVPSLHMKQPAPPTPTSTSVGRPSPNVTSSPSASSASACSASGSRPTFDSSPAPSNDHL